MPVLMRLERLDEAGSFPIGLCRPSVKQSGLFEHPVHAAGRNSHHIIVEHHKGKAPIPLIGIGPGVFDNTVLFPLLQPEIPRDHAIMLVHLAIALLPRAVFARGQSGPIAQSIGRQFGSLYPIGDEINNGIPRVVRYPGAAQSSPRFFFSLMCSSISSESTSFLVWSFFSRASIFLEC